jgi:TPR repeat protein
MFSANQEKNLPLYLLAEAGDAESQFRLGAMYAAGEDVPQNFIEAMKWYHKAAEQGNIRAQLNLGRMYATGQDALYYFSKSLKWHLKFVEREDDWAQNNIGQTYASGSGVSQDFSKAMKWWRLAAEQGDMEAKTNIGQMYADGDGVLQDSAEAIRWWRLAAEQGDVWAQRNLNNLNQTKESQPIQTSAVNNKIIAKSTRANGILNNAPCALVECDMARFYLHMIRQDSAYAQATFIQDWRETIKKWLGASSDNFSELQIQKWEKTYLSYLAEGNPPKAEYAEIFK